MILRATLAFVVTPLASGLFAQCPERDSLEYLNTIRSSTIKYEVMSLIPWVWEYEGKEQKPLMNRIQGLALSDDEVRFEGRGVRVQISQQPFDSLKAKIGYGSTDSYRFVCAINGAPFWGTDGDRPTRMLSGLSVTIDGGMVEIPRRAWSDLYQPNLCFVDGNGKPYCDCVVARSADNKRVYVHMSNSDGAGGYTVTWIFINGRYVRRVLEGPP
ncbi:MAG: hypothetical protein IPP83_14130 [Flavobacteriales bacterium]|nr:hypothetical protein [Flavobacteriales bacterium]